MADIIGQRLGNYEIIDLLGEGGMATVYRARQLNIKRDVAIKVIESKLARNPEFVKRFEREAQTIAALNHPHILKLFDFGQQGDLIYLVMELQPGGSLADLIRKGPMPVDQVGRLLEQIASALDYAHRQGVIHRDLKPQNVLLDPDGNAILTDFGIAKILNESTSLTVSGTAMGTPSYMSPEQWQALPLDLRTDIYALGVMSFEMLSGKLPFNADTPFGMMHLHINQQPPPIRAFRPDLSPVVEAVLRQALAKDRDERYATAGEMATAFKAALAGKASKVSSTRAAPLQNVPTRRRRSRLLVIGAIILIAAIGVLVVILSLGGQNANPTTPTRNTQVAAGVTATSTALATATATITPVIPTHTLRPTLTPLPPSSTFTETHTATVTRTATATRTPTIPTITPSTTYTPTEEPNLETLAAQTIAARATKTAIVEASYTKTLTYTPTITPNKQQTLAAIVAATETANAIASFTKTPTATHTLSPTATFTSTVTNILINESFSDPLTLNFTSQSDFWEIIADETGNMVLDANTTSTGSDASSDFGAVSWGNIAIDYRVRILDAHGDYPTATLFFRRNDRGSYLYSLTLYYHSSELLYTDSRPGSSWQLLNGRSIQLQNNVWYNIRVEIRNSQIKAFINDKLINQVTDDRLTNGSLALVVAPAAHVQFDDIEVTVLGD